MRIFVPAVFLLMGLMVWLAVQPGLERSAAMAETARRAAEEGLTIAGAALSNALAAPGTTFQFTDDPAATRLIARAGTSFENRQASVGVFFSVPPALVAGLVGEEVRMTVEVRAARQAPARAMQLSGHVMNGPASGWSRFEVGDDYREYSFTWVLPPPEGKPVLVAVWPDDEGDGGGVDIREVRITRVDSAAAPSDGTAPPAR